MPTGRKCVSKARLPMQSATPTLRSARMQGTGGSSAMANSWMQLREAGGKARAMLLDAAAKEWKIPAAELTVDKGVVYHAGSKRQATFGSLVATAVSLPVPDTVTLKDPKDFKLIGHQVPRVDVPAKVDGTAQFTLDVALPGMLVALLEATAAIRRHGQVFRCELQRLA